MSAKATGPKETEARAQRAAKAKKAPPVEDVTGKETDPLAVAKTVHETLLAAVKALVPGATELAKDNYVRFMTPDDQTVVYLYKPTKGGVRVEVPAFMVKRDTEVARAMQAVKDRVAHLES